MGRGVRRTRPGSEPSTGICHLGRLGHSVPYSEQIIISTIGLGYLGTHITIVRPDVHVDCKNQHSRSQQEYSARPR